jgi:hypothetical protein
VLEREWEGTGAYEKTQLLQIVCYKGEQKMEQLSWRGLQWLLPPVRREILLKLCTNGNEAEQIAGMISCSR